MILKKSCKWPQYETTRALLLHIWKLYATISSGRKFVRGQQDLKNSSGSYIEKYSLQPVKVSATKLVHMTTPDVHWICREGEQVQACWLCLCTITWYTRRYDSAKDMDCVYNHTISIAGLGKLLITGKEEFLQPFPPYSSTCWQPDDHSGDLVSLNPLCLPDFQWADRAVTCSRLPCTC